jgi:hypothetical protein
MNTLKESEEQPRKVVSVKLQIVVEAAFDSLFHDNYSVGQLQSEATDRAVAALGAILVAPRASGTDIHFKILDRGSAEIKVR